MIFGAVSNYVYAAVVTADQFDSVEGNGAAILTVIYWFFFIPTVLSLGVGLYELWYYFDFFFCLSSFRQGKWKRSIFAYILFVIAFGHVLALGIFFAIVDILAAAIVTWGILILVLVGLGVYYIHHKNNKSYPRKVVVIAGWSGGAILSAIFIVSLCMDSFNDFLGFSFSYLSVLLCLTLYAVKHLIADFASKSTVKSFLDYHF